MFSLPLLFSLVALGVAGWAVWFLVLATVAATRAKDELRAGRLELVTWQQRAADQEAARITAVQLLDEMTQIRTAETAAFATRGSRRSSTSTARS